MMKSNNYLSLGEAIEKFLERHGLKETAKIQEVLARWENLMGKPIAGNTEKIWFNKGTLYIKMKSPIWKNELLLARNKIRQMMNDQLKADIIKEVKVW